VRKYGRGGERESLFIRTERELYAHAFGNILLKSLPRISPTPMSGTSLGGTHLCAHDTKTCGCSCAKCLLTSPSDARGSERTVLAWEVEHLHKKKASQIETQRGPLVGTLIPVARQAKCLGQYSPDLSLRRVSAA